MFANLKVFENFEIRSPHSNDDNSPKGIIYVYIGIRRRKCCKFGIFENDFFKFKYKLPIYP